MHPSASDRHYLSFPSCSSTNTDCLSLVDAFATNLLGFPLDVSILSDAVYANSTTMNGKHFAEEFVRRKRLADKGVVEKQPSTNSGKAGSSSGAGSHGGSGRSNDSEGWNEVAKKGGAGGGSGSGSGHRDDSSVPGGQFKVVPGRKKGKK